MISLVKKPALVMIEVWIWEVRDQWVFSMLPDEPVRLFYADAGWHIDRAKEFFSEHKGYPFNRCHFTRCEAPAEFRRKRNDPVAKRQLIELEKRKLEKPVYAGEKEMKKRGEYIAKFNEEIKKSNSLVTQNGSLTTFEQKRFTKKGWNLTDRNRSKDSMFYHRIYKNSYRF